VIPVGRQTIHYTLLERDRQSRDHSEIRFIKFGVADFEYESFFTPFLKSRLKQTFSYVQNQHSYLD
jgi:hypothetical protein